LLTDILAELAVNVSQIAINALVDDTFYATVRLALNQSHYEIDARPSDAINIAVRAGAAIYVAPDVMDKAGKAARESPPGDLQPLVILPWTYEQLVDEPEP
jgi:bifunctional DNase/RNase